MKEKNKGKPEAFSSRWKKDFRKNKNLIFLSLIFLAIAVTLTYIASSYADKVGSASVTDIILDHIPVVNLMLAYILGSIIVTFVLFFYPSIFKVKELYVVICQFSLLYIIRSFFISLTHLTKPVDSLILQTPAFGKFFMLAFQNDLFFSGHTAEAFLGFLLFRKTKVGIFFLIATIGMMATVLLMHVHYSIDVFAALFIAYGSYKIGEWLFKK